MSTGASPFRFAFIFVYGERRVFSRNESDINCFFVCSFMFWLVSFYRIQIYSRKSRFPSRFRLSFFLFSFPYSCDVSSPSAQQLCVTSSKLRKQKKKIHILERIHRYGTRMLLLGCCCGCGCDETQYTMTRRLQSLHQMRRRAQMTNRDTDENEISRNRRI